MMNAIYLPNGPKVRHGLGSSSFEAVRVSGQRAGLEKLAERERGASKSARIAVKGLFRAFRYAESSERTKRNLVHAKLSDGPCLAKPKVALFVQKQAEQP